ncbi:hypothetical protein ACIQD3_22855 [Peribacillus loiseleuriae]|uniref:hypothetical protein n=1 Tax=Peribacillus loiseleuriae TaxID=1679170 RepID=UPI0037FB4BF7
MSSAIEYLGRETDARNYKHLNPLFEIGKMNEDKPNFLLVESLTLLVESSGEIDLDIAILKNQVNDFIDEKQNG